MQKLMSIIAAESEPGWKLFIYGYGWFSKYEFVLSCRTEYLLLDFWITKLYCVGH